MRIRTRIMTLMFAVLLMSAFTASALALDAAHEVRKVTSAVTGTDQSDEPFSIALSDEILYEIALLRPLDEPEVSRIDIQLSGGLAFVRINNVWARDDEGNTLALDEPKLDISDDEVGIYFYGLPEDLNEMRLTYVCRTERPLSVGTNGMSNTAVIHQAGEFEDELTEIKSRAVYTWHMTLWTIDSDKAFAETKYAGDKLVESMHPGQGVEGTEFEIYFDEDLTRPAKFYQSFRRYDLAPDFDANATSLIHIDAGGRVDVNGLPEARYYIVEKTPPTGYGPLTTMAIPVEITHDVDAMPDMRVQVLYPELYDSSTIHITGDSIGAEVLLDYGSGDTGFSLTWRQSTTAFIIVAVAVLIGAAAWEIRKNPDNVNNNGNQDES